MLTEQPLTFARGLQGTGLCLSSSEPHNDLMTKAKAVLLFFNNIFSLHAFVENLETLGSPQEEKENLQRLGISPDSIFPYFLPIFLCTYIHLFSLLFLPLSTLLLFIFIIL